MPGYVSNLMKVITASLQLVDFLFVSVWRYCDLISVRAVY